MPVTALGEHVIRYAQRVLNDAKHFVEDIEILRLGGHGFLKIGGNICSDRSSNSKLNYRN